MVRRLFSLASAVSLLLCVAVCVLWVDSLVSGRPGRPALSVRSPRALYQVGAEPRRWGIDWVLSPRSTQGPWRLRGRVYSVVPDGLTSNRYHALGFTVAWLSTADADRWNARSHFLVSPFVAGVLPYWFVALATGILPARLFWSRRRRDRGLRLGLCPSCGYDLRATPERCPECGAVPPREEAPTAAGSGR